MKNTAIVAECGPVPILGGSSAVWPFDKVTILGKVGSRRICLVHSQSFIALIPKKWLRRI